MAFGPCAQNMLRRFVGRLAADTSGATAIELCFLTALISVAIIGSLHSFSNQLNNTFDIVAKYALVKN